MYPYPSLGVSYASPLQTSIARPVPVGYAAPLSYAAPVSYAAPISYAAPVSYAQPQYSPIRGESRVEYVPYQKPVVELEEEVRTVQVCIIRQSNFFNILLTRLQFQLEI